MYRLWRCFRRSMWHILGAYHSLRLRRQGMGVVVRCTRLPHSSFFPFPPFPLYPFHLSLFLSFSLLFFFFYFFFYFFFFFFFPFFPPLHGLSRHFASLVFSKNSFVRPRHGPSGNFASLVVSKKVPPTLWDFDFFSKISPILKFEVGLLSDKKFLKFFLEIRWITCLYTNYDQSFKKFT